MFVPCQQSPWYSSCRQPGLLITSFGTMVALGAFGIVKMHRIAKSIFRKLRRGPLLTTVFRATCSTLQCKIGRVRGGSWIRNDRCIAVQELQNWMSDSKWEMASPTATHLFLHPQLLSQSTFYDNNNTNGSRHVLAKHVLEAKAHLGGPVGLKSSFIANPGSSFTAVYLSGTLATLLASTTLHFWTTRGSDLNALLSFCSLLFLFLPPTSFPL